MIDLFGAELLGLAQASVGWAVLAIRAAEPAAEAVPAPELRSPTAPMRFRATITIEIDAHDMDEVERQSEAVRGQFELLKRAHPSAVLAIQRRKPRAGRRAPAPSVVVAPYVDD